MTDLGGAVEHPNPPDLHSLATRQSLLPLGCRLATACPQRRDSPRCASTTAHSTPGRESSGFSSCQARSSINPQSILGRRRLALGVVSSLAAPTMAACAPSFKGESAIRYDGGFGLRSGTHVCAPWSMVFLKERERLKRSWTLGKLAVTNGSLVAAMVV